MRSKSKSCYASCRALPAVSTGLGGPYDVPSTNAAIAHDGSEASTDDSVQHAALVAQMDAEARQDPGAGATLQHALHDSAAHFAPKRPLRAQPMLWNLVPCHHPDGSPTPLPMAQLPAAPATHRAGCLPTLVLLAVPSVALAYLKQAIEAGDSVSAAAKGAPPALVPVDGMSAVEAALIAEAARGPAWQLGPTAGPLLRAQCAAVACARSEDSAINLQLRVQAALSAFFVARHVQLHVQHAATSAKHRNAAADDGVHTLSLQLPAAGVGTYDLPAVLFILARSLQELWPLLDAAAVVTEATQDCADAAAQPRAAADAALVASADSAGKQATHAARHSKHTGNGHRSRVGDLTSPQGLHEPGMHPLPAWPFADGVDEDAALPTLLLCSPDPDRAPSCHVVPCPA